MLDISLSRVRLLDVFEQGTGRHCLPAQHGSLSLELVIAVSRIIFVSTNICHCLYYKSTHLLFPNSH